MNTDKEGYRILFRGITDGALNGDSSLGRKPVPVLVNWCPSVVEGLFNRTAPAK